MNLQILQKLQRIILHFVYFFTEEKTNTVTCILTRECVEAAKSPLSYKAVNLPHR